MSVFTTDPDDRDVHFKCDSTGFVARDGSDVLHITIPPGPGHIAIRLTT
jgi:hypothetical protein